MMEMTTMRPSAGMPRRPLTLEEDSILDPDDDDFDDTLPADLWFRARRARPNPAPAKAVRKRHWRTR